MRKEAKGTFVIDFFLVAEWRGTNLKEAQNFQNIDVLVLAINQGRSEELREVLYTQCGIMNYVKNFWQGFYPLLLLELTNSDNNEAQKENTVSNFTLLYFTHDKSLRDFS